MERRWNDEKARKGGRWKRDGQKERELEVSSRASYLQGPCIHSSALLTTERPMEGDRELRGTWFRQERSSVVVVGPRVERCRVADFHRSPCFSSNAFAWIQFLPSVVRFASADVRTRKRFGEQACEHERFALFSEWMHTEDRRNEKRLQSNAVRL